jgi:DivIVA domain-containing protein
MSIFDPESDIGMMSQHDPRQIRARQFVRVKKGFDPDQVRAFLDEIATQIEQLQSELRFTQEERDAAARRASPDPYTQLGAHVAELVRGAEEHAERIRRDAQEEADRLMAEAARAAEAAKQEAEARADELKENAEKEASRLREEARSALERATAEAHASVATLRKERDRLLAHVHAAREGLGAALAGLDQALASMKGPEAEESGAQESPPAALEEREEVDPAASETEPPPAPAEHIASEDEAERRAKRPTELPELPDIWELTAQLERRRKGVAPDDEIQTDQGARAGTVEAPEVDPADLDIQIPDLPFVDERNDPGRS